MEWKVLFLYNVVIKWIIVSKVKVLFLKSRVKKGKFSLLLHLIKFTFFLSRINIWRQKNYWPPGSVLSLQKTMPVTRQ